MHKTHLQYCHDQQKGITDMTTLKERWIQEGRLEVKWLVVQNSLSKGLPIDDIAYITGLPMKMVKEMQTIIEQKTPSPIPLRKRLNLDEFSFKRSRELLKEYKGSLSDAVIEERRGNN